MPNHGTMCRTRTLSCPVIEVSQHGAQLSDVIGQLILLLALIIALGGILALFQQHQRYTG